MEADMLQTNWLLKDLYNERWGDPLDHDPVGAPAPSRDDRCQTSLFDVLALVVRLLLRPRPKRSDAWSFTIPIDRRLRDLREDRFETHTGKSVMSNERDTPKDCNRRRGI
jgi:hypothetical protein